MGTYQNCNYFVRHVGMTNWLNIILKIKLLDISIYFNKKKTVKNQKKMILKY